MKSLLFRLHGWLGISAGLVLAIVGTTGALLSFEPQILRLLNPGVLVIAPEARPLLTPVELYQRVSAARPEQVVQTLTLSGVADRPAQVVYAKPGSTRGESVWVQPYSGELLPEERGHDAMHLIEDMHRKLLVDSLGKAVTGASALILVFMALSGLYLRWSRRPRGLRGWFLLRGGIKGRAFLWQLHAVGGTWMLVIFLFSAGTGLLWSYDWYKAGVAQVLGAEVPAKKKPNREQPEPVAPEQFAERMGTVWPAFQAQVPAYASAAIAVDGINGKAVKIDYVLPDAVHERAKNTVKITADGRIKDSELFVEQPWGKRIFSSWKMLHTGQYWGWGGQLVLMLSSLSMLAFFYIGVRLYFTGARKAA